jgi:phenylalanyl-tRNA synthetase beta chain
MMLGLGIQNLVNENNKAEAGYYIKSSEGTLIFFTLYVQKLEKLTRYLLRLPSTDATYFPGRSATIYYRPSKTASAPARLAPAESADPSDASVAVEASSSESTPTATTETSSPHHSGPLDTLKEKLSSALPSVLKKHHHEESSSSSSTSAPAAAALSRDVAIGSLGILHPSVLKSYELDFPCSALEFDLEPFL